MILIFFLNLNFELWSLKCVCSQNFVPFALSCFWDRSKFKLFQIFWKISGILNYFNFLSCDRLQCVWSQNFIRLLDKCKLKFFFNFLKVLEIFNYFKNFEIFELWSLTMCLIPYFRPFALPIYNRLCDKGKFRKYWVIEIFVLWSLPFLR